MVIERVNQDCIDSAKNDSKASFLDLDYDSKNKKQSWFEELRFEMLIECGFEIRYEMSVWIVGKSGSLYLFEILD